jgi:hypothetical protein
MKFQYKIKIYLILSLLWKIPQTWQEKYKAEVKVKVENNISSASAYSST